MINPVATDMIKFLNKLVSLLQPFAQSHHVAMVFKPKEKNLMLLLRPDVAIVDITNLLCHMISYMPHGNTITLTAAIEGNEFKLRIINTGIDLSIVSEITKCCKSSLAVKGDTQIKQTLFVWSIPVTFPETEEDTDMPPAYFNKITIPSYYDEIRKRLRSHFSKAENLVAQLSLQYPREAAFLQKINTVIISNMDNELFDASMLSREMNMSRASLFRRLKPLIRQAPASYIKSVRLQKAKEILETTDISVGSAAFQTGFQTQSHFTKAFTEMFGFLPSSIRRKKNGETK